MTQAAGVVGFGNSQSRTAYDRYVMGLESAFRWREIVDDPTFVLADDADLYAKIRRDPVFAHALDMRKRRAAGREWTIEPASKGQEDMRLAKITKAALGQIKGFTMSRFNLAESIPRGSAYARVEGRRMRITVDGDPAASKMLWWVPTALRDVDRRRWSLRRLTPDTEPVWHLRSIQRMAWEVVPPDELALFVRLTYQATEDTLGYGRGLLESLFFYAAAKTDLFRDGLEAAERFGQGLVKVALERYAEDQQGPGDGARSRAEAARESIRKSRKDGVITYPKGDEVDGLTVGAEGWQLIHSLIDYIDSRVVMCALGANLPTLAESGGSFAQAAIQQDSEQTVSETDREGMSEAITDGPVDLFARINAPNLRALGLHDAHPGKFALVHEVTASDPAAFATTVTTLADRGLKIRAQEVRERIGLSEPMPGDELLEGSAPQTSAPDPLADPMTPGGVAAPPGGGAPRPNVRVLGGGA